MIEWGGCSQLQWICEMGPVCVKTGPRSKWCPALAGSQDSCWVGFCYSVNPHEQQWWQLISACKHCLAFPAKPLRVCSNLIPVWPGWLWLQFCPIWESSGQEVLPFPPAWGGFGDTLAVRTVLELGHRRLKAEAVEPSSYLCVSIWIPVQEHPLGRSWPEEWGWLCNPIWSSV